MESPTQPIILMLGVMNVTHQVMKFLVVVSCPPGDVPRQTVDLPEQVKTCSSSTIQYFHEHTGCMGVVHEQAPDELLPKSLLLGMMEFHNHSRELYFHLHSTDRRPGLFRSPRRVTLKSST